MCVSIYEYIYIYILNGELNEYHWFIIYIDLYHLILHHIYNHIQYNPVSPSVHQCLVGSDGSSSRSQNLAKSMAPAPRSQDLATPHGVDGSFESFMFFHLFGSSE